MSWTSGGPTGKRSQAVPPLCFVGETSKTVLILTYNPRTNSNGYIHQSGTKLQTWFQDKAVGFAMDNFDLLEDLLAKERMSRRRNEADVRRRGGMVNSILLSSSP